MEYLEVIKKRYSARSYKSDEIEQKKLDTILEAARIAPTAANRQAFKILIIKTKDREDELKKIYNKSWFIEAPLILGVCSIPQNCWIRRDNKNYSDVDAAIVMDHIILTATDLGLGTCWIGAFDPKIAKEVLDLDDSMELVALTPVGYVKEDTIRRPKKPLEDLVIYKQQYFVNYE